MDKKAVSWAWLVLSAHWGVNRNYSSKKKNLDLVLNSKSTWSPASILNLKMWILKIRALQTNNFEFLKSCAFQNEKMDRKWTDLTLRNKTPPPLFLPEIKNILNSTQNPKFQLPLTLAAVHLMLGVPLVVNTYLCL